MFANWKELFPSKILERGFDYYKSGAVKEFEFSDGCCSAIVEGSYDYNVSIEFDDGDILDMECDCPYAEDGEYCKHEAAVLFYMDEQNKHRSHNEIQEASTHKVIENSEKNIDNNQHDASTFSSGIKKMISSLDEKTVKKLLYDAVVDNPSLLDSIVKVVPSNAIDHSYFVDLLRRASSFIMNMESDDYYSDYYGNDDTVYAAIDGLNDLLKEKIEPLAEEGKNCVEVFKLVSDILDKIPFDYLDDNDYDSITDVVFSIESIMDKAYSNAENKAELVREAKARRFNSDSYSIYEDFLIFTVKDKELAKKNLDSIRKKEVFEVFAYSVERVVKLMTVLEYNDDEIDKDLMNHLDLSSAQTILARRLNNRGKWQQCIDVIKNILTKYKRNSECFLMLKSIYAEHGMNNELIDLIYYDILSTTQYNLDSINELESMVSKERWKDISEKLKKSPSMRIVMPYFLESIEAYSDLMDWFEKDGSANNLEYGPLLLKLFPERTLNAYKSILFEEEKYLEGRDSYRKYADILEDLIPDEKGRVFVESHVKELLNTYSRRPALKDELQKMLKKNNL